MIDFELPAEVKDVQTRLAAFIKDVVLPAEQGLGADLELEGDALKDVVAGLRDKARSAGLYNPHLPPE